MRDELATIREVKRWGGTAFQAIVRRRGYNVSLVLETRQRARDWAAKAESAINASTPERPFDPASVLPSRAEVQELPEVEADPDEHPEPSVNWTVRRAFEHYEETVLKGGKSEWKQRSRTGAWKERELADKRLNEVTRGDVRRVIAERKDAGKKPSTVRNDLYMLSALFTVAADPTGWNLDLTNPVNSKELPELPPHRKTRLQDARGGNVKSHEQRLRDALALGPDPQEMDDIVTIALDTGMRRGEIVCMTADDLRREDGVDSLYVPKTKTVPRTVILTMRAAEILERRSLDKGPLDRLFTLNGDNVQYRLQVARARAGLTHIRFHDLRHEGLSRMANRGLTVGELQSQSGHSTAQILLTYINSRPPDIAKKLG